MVDLEGELGVMKLLSSLWDIVCVSVARGVLYVSVATTRQGREHFWGWERETAAKMDSKERQNSRKSKDWGSWTESDLGRQQQQSPL